MVRKFCFAFLLMLAVFVTGAVAEPLEHLKAQNKKYLDARSNDADISQEIRKHTAEKGQAPFTIVITCSDSRVIPEHIFMAGIGELFVIRTAGNVVGAFERGSVEYGLEHLGSKLVVVLGHSSCGTVAAALGEEELHGDIEIIVKEVRLGIKGEKDSGKAERLNIENSISRLRESKIIRELEVEGKIKVCGAKYEISTGKVTMF